MGLTKKLGQKLSKCRKELSSWVCGIGDLGEQLTRSELEHKTSYYARIWAQNTRKMSLRHIPESVANLFLCLFGRLSQRRLNNASRWGGFKQGFSILAWGLQRGPTRNFPKGSSHKQDLPRRTYGFLQVFFSLKKDTRWFSCFDVEITRVACDMLSDLFCVKMGARNREAQ